MDPVTICNMALGALAQHKIASFDDDSDAAELCSTFFWSVVKTVLEQRAWLFATGSVDLGAVQASDDAEFPSKFALPNTIIRTLRLDDGFGDWKLRGERRGAWIYTEAATKCLARAVNYEEDTSKWTPTFCWAVAYKLAETIAGPLTENAAVESRMEKKYLRELSDAGTLDGMQSWKPEKLTITHGGRTLSSRR